jgi:hypothetical protein
MGGHLVFVTWGELQGATRDYVQHWIEDGVCCLSREYMGANNLSPELIDWAALLNDIDAIANAARTPVSAHVQAARHQPVQPEPEQREHDAKHSADQRAEEPIEHSEPEPQPAKPHRKRQPEHKPKRKPPRKPR